MLPKNNILSAQLRHIGLVRVHHLRMNTNIQKSSVKNSMLLEICGPWSFPYARYELLEGPFVARMATILRNRSNCLTKIPSWPTIIWWLLVGPVSRVVSWCRIRRISSWFPMKHYPVLIECQHREKHHLQNFHQAYDWPMVVSIATKAYHLLEHCNYTWWKNVNVIHQEPFQATLTNFGRNAEYFSLENYITFIDYCRVVIYTWYTHLM